MRRHPRDVGHGSASKAARPGRAKRPRPTQATKQLGTAQRDTSTEGDASLGPYERRYDVLLGYGAERTIVQP